MAQENVYKWSFIERVSLAVLNFGGNIVLTRMLTADDFGLLAMVAVIIATASNLSSCGLSDGLIHKLKPTPLDYSTVFVFNSAVGLIFAIASTALAGPIARFFGHQELVWIMRMYGICFFFQTMSFVQETRLRKRLEMKKLCIARVAATVTALALGILLAALGCGYWALISTQIFLSFFMFVYIVALAQWFPRPAFSLQSFREFFGYGVHLMLTYVINVVGQNINTFILGRCYTSAQTGLYYQGAKLANVPFSVTESSFNSPFFVVASNEADPECRRTKILDMMGIIVTLNASIALLLLLIATPAIAFLYGVSWIGAAPVMKVLAIFGCVMCVKYFFQTIFKIYGRTNLVRNMALCEFVVQMTLLAIFFRRGLVAVAMTQLGACIVSVAIYSVIASRTMRLTARELRRSMLTPLLLPVPALLAGAAVSLGLHYVCTPAAIVDCLVISAVYLAVLLPTVGRIRPAYLATLRRLRTRRESGRRR